MEPPFETGPSWRKHRGLVREGFRDLEYLPRGRTGWNATLAACAYSVRQHVAGQADLGIWAAMHGVPASARWEALGRNALVLWHGTSAERAARIREVGLFPKKGVWATTEPSIAHGFTRSRCERFGAGSAMVVMVLDRLELEREGGYDQESPTIFRFHSRLPAELVEYILLDDRILFTGAARAAAPRSWGIARFRRREGRWTPLSRPPVRLDEHCAYRTLDEWLDLSVRRILATLGAASAVEVFSSLYATIDPWEALEHARIIEACERLCGPPRPRKGFLQYRPRAEEEGAGPKAS